jgi:hypothetical protein
VRIIGNRARDIEGPASPMGRIDASRRQVGSIPLCDLDVGRVATHCVPTATHESLGCHSTQREAVNQLDQRLERDGCTTLRSGTAETEA